MEGYRWRKRVLVLAPLLQARALHTWQWPISHTYPYLNPSAHIYDSVARAILPPQTYCSLQAYLPSNQRELTQPPRPSIGPNVPRGPSSFP